ncbi:conserved hypothetical protein [Alkaliphilus metalliredigens QYMF]|uniref:ABC-2 type transport system permease protein n=1 Tax=Alkaliphilus metalliredigens (strain QYMF) TaxID=293826 RepID=A6TLI1_ALKMQ|nr:hypothetical protein [Alkaliphilus metalliredigens]ABR47049.1 conserved hypothetical protein [Alkaliphilus metalliredigens QYMF]
MNQFISLLKMHMNVNFSISALKYKYFKQKNDLWQPLAFIVLFLALLPLYITLIRFIQVAYTIFDEINQSGVLLVMGFLGAQMLLFIFGISHIFAKFYYAEDIQRLIPLPIKPIQLLTARFFTVMVNEYLTVLPFVLPILIVFGSRSGGGVLYWLYALLLFVTLPIIPLALSTILVMLFMRYTNIKGNRDLLRAAGGILMVIFILGIQVMIRSMTIDVPVGDEVTYLAELMKQNNVLIRQMGLVFPPAMWAAYALTTVGTITGFLYLLLFIGVSAIIFYFMLVFTRNFFYEGLIEGQEIAVKKKKLSDEGIHKKLGKLSHPIVAMFVKEMRLLVRTPIFLMNSIGTVIVIPFAMGISLYMSGDILGQISSYYTPENFLIIHLLMAGFIIFISASNGLAPTLFSREGKQFWIVRILPVKIEHQLIGKILSNLAVQLLAIVLLLGAASIVVNLQVQTVIIVLLLGILGSIPITQLSMFIDITRPVLDWDNPQQAMKQNMNVFISLLAGMAYLIGLGIIARILIAINLMPMIVYLIFAVGLIVLSGILFKNLTNLTYKRYREIS